MPHAPGPPRGRCVPWGGPAQPQGHLGRAGMGRICARPDVPTARLLPSGGAPYSPGAGWPASCVISLRSPSVRRAGAVPYPTGDVTCLRSHSHLGHTRPAPPWNTPGLLSRRVFTWTGTTRSGALPGPRTARWPVGTVDRSTGGRRSTRECSDRTLAAPGARDTRGWALSCQDSWEGRPSGSWAEGRLRGFGGQPSSRQQDEPGSPVGHWPGLLDDSGNPLPICSESRNVPSP